MMAGSSNPTHGSTLLPSPFASSSSTLASPRESRTPHATTRTVPGPLTTRYDNPAGLYSPRTLTDRNLYNERDSPARRMLERDEHETLVDDEGDDDEEVMLAGERIRRATSSVPPGTPPRRLLDMFLQSASPEVKRAVSASESVGTRASPRANGSTGMTDDHTPTWSFYEDPWDGGNSLAGTPAGASYPLTGSDVDDIEADDAPLPPSNENAPPPRTISSMAPPQHRHRRSTSLLSQTAIPSNAEPTATVSTPSASRSPASSSTVAQTPSPVLNAALETATVTPRAPGTPPPIDLDMLDDDLDLAGPSFAETEVDSFARPTHSLLLPGFELGFDRPRPAVGEETGGFGVRRGKRPSHEGPAWTQNDDEDTLSEEPTKKKRTAVA